MRRRTIPLGCPARRAAVVAFDPRSALQPAATAPIAHGHLLAVEVEPVAIRAAAAGRRLPWAKPKASAAGAQQVAPPPHDHGGSSAGVIATEGVGDAAAAFSTTGRWVRHAKGGPRWPGVAHCAPLLLADAALGGARGAPRRKAVFRTGGVVVGRRTSSGSVLAPESGLCRLFALSRHHEPTAGGNRSGGETSSGPHVP